MVSKYLYRFDHNLQPQALSGQVGISQQKSQHSSKMHTHAYVQSLIRENSNGFSSFPINAMLISSPTSPWLPMSLFQQQS